MHKSILMKCIHMFFHWLNAVPKAIRAKMKEPASVARHSLKFLNDQTGAGESLVFFCGLR